MAAYLDLEYYAYRGEYKKLLKIIKHLTGNFNKGSKKTFTREEIIAFFQMKDVYVILMI